MATPVTPAAATPGAAAAAPQRQMKYIVVTGGVVSGLGKGITISSIGRLLKANGLRVTSIKIDPYLNTDAGTMSPFEHGETFVLDDGGETDLDLGNYERFLDLALTRDHNITTGKVYAKVIERERKGDYLGKTVQVVPHVTNEIQEWIEKVARVPTDGRPGAPDVCLVEVGGTVGDIESAVFLEALRQFQFQVKRENFCLVHVSLVPCLGVVGEQKTKPTQHGVKELRGLGLSPDVIVCRGESELEEATRKKLGIFCHVDPSRVLSVHDVPNIYHVPLMLEKQGMDEILRNRLELTRDCGMAAQREGRCDLAAWRAMAESIETFTEAVTIALVGKYTNLQDAYLSVYKALKHSSIECGRRLDLEYVDSEKLEPGAEGGEEAWEKVKNADGVVVPGGFGVRGVEGMIACAKFCREQKKPYLGVCLGMQVAVVEYARHKLGWAGAHSTEFDKECEKPTVIFMPEALGEKGELGGTMRLGARDTILHEDAWTKRGEASIASLVYRGAAAVPERHRHRYEVNPDVVPELEKAGLRFVGKDDTNTRMEIVELPRSAHPFYFAAQFHPEFKSRPQNPSPPFFGFVLAAAKMFPAGLAKRKAAAAPSAAKKMRK